MITHRFALTAVVLAASIAVAASCTAFRVVTHRNDPAFAAVPAGRYTLDPQHWSVSFDVSHLGYSRFAMRFDHASAALDVAPGGLATSRVDATLDAASIDTNVPILDKMIAGPQMLDAAQEPRIEFVSTSFVPDAAGHGGTLAGTLTIRGHSAPVMLRVTFNGASPDPLTKREKLGFSATGSFKRSAWGLTTWYPAVGDEVQVRIEAEFNRIDG